MTLIELMIVTAVIAIIAAIAVPSFYASRIRANESAAIATLKLLATAQAQVISSLAIDSNNDGVSEFGFFQELSGQRATRIDAQKGDGLADSESGTKLDPTALSAAFGQVDENGVVRRNGYYFRMYLPGQDVRWEREDAPDKNYRKVSGDHASSYWACYAWPVSYGLTGNRAFFINQSGDILVCTNEVTRYSGVGKGQSEPKKESIIIGTFGGDKKKASMSDTISVNTVGQDGNFWRVVR